MKKEKVLKWIKGMTKANKIIASAVMFIVVIGIATGVIFYDRGSKLTTISKASLQKVIEINELSTVDYTYNAIATKYNEDNTKVMYHVAYEGTITAGIDFYEIDVDVIEEEKKVVITLPEVEIHDIRVDMGTMDYIFIKDKYETETISQEAYKLCKSDLQKRIEKENVLYKTAKENAKQSVEALFKPWIETIDSEYVVEIQ